MRKKGRKTAASFSPAKIVALLPLKSAGYFLKLAVRPSWPHSESWRETSAASYRRRLRGSAPDFPRADAFRDCRAPTGHAACRSALLRTPELLRLLVRREILQRIL